MHVAAGWLKAVSNCLTEWVDRCIISYLLAVLAHCCAGPIVVHVLLAVQVHITLVVIIELVPHAYLEDKGYLPVDDLKLVNCPS